MIDDERYARYLTTLRARYPRFRLIDKADSPLCRVIDRVLKVVTAGGQSRFMTDYVTTIGGRVYLPSTWSSRPVAARYCVMRHEAVHLAQFERLGLVGMSALYVLLPLPFGFAAGRAWIEWEAYRETVIATWQVYGRQAAVCPQLRADIVRRFTGPDYGWMWLRGKTIEAALDRLLMELEVAPPAPLR